ncbi:MAG: homoserine O-succinyltransferase [Micavibrio sp.]|nr:homoserine O-succinyltransferase [Micavibrio sp.]
MPIKIPDGLPGRAILEREKVPLILEGRALRQDIRPLQIAVLNLMPDKITTETQLLRALGNTPLQIEVTLLHAASHTSKNTAAEHLTAFYQTHADVAHRHFDALVVTGAPVEQLPFTDVTYWKELTRIFDWAKTHVHSRLFICWGAQAALHYYHGIDKQLLPQKKSGLYLHSLAEGFDPLTAGFDDFFDIPVSRHTEVVRADILKHKNLSILAENPQSGVGLVHDRAARDVYIFNHLEYDADTLKREYTRDHAAGLAPELPNRYFPGDNPAAAPQVTWRAHRSLLFGNWINLVYQTTPYELAELEALPKAA